MANYGMGHDSDDKPAIQSQKMTNFDRDRNTISLREGDVMNISGLLTRHNEELLKLRETVGMLIDRIMPAMGPPRPEPGGEVADDTPDRSELARVIDSHTDMVVSMRRNIDSVIGRVEL